MRVQLRCSQAGAQPRVRVRSAGSHVRANPERQNPEPCTQGMADLDPDVDAIYRLTQNLGVNFETDVASVVLPEGVMCPWNSQNTLFEREALWGMLIPVTTTFRVCDIWRSYWVQVRRPAARCGAGAGRAHRARERALLRACTACVKAHDLLVLETSAGGALPRGALLFSSGTRAPHSLLGWDCCANIQKAQCQFGQWAYSKPSKGAGCHEAAYPGKPP